MEVFIKNNTGKKIFLRLLLKPSAEPGILHEIIFELHSTKPMKTKETVAIRTIMNGSTERSTVQETKNLARLSNQMDWKIDYTEVKGEKSILYKITSRN